MITKLHLTLLALTMLLSYGFNNHALSASNHELDPPKSNWGIMLFQTTAILMPRFSISAYLRSLKSELGQSKSVTSAPKPPQWGPSAAQVSAVTTPLISKLAEADDDDNKVSKPEPHHIINTGSSVKILAKTVTYEGISVIGDFVYGVVFASLAGGIGLATASIISEPALYLFHELAWDQAEDSESDMFAEEEEEPDSASISLKTTTFALANTVRILGSAWLVTGSLTATLGFFLFSNFEDSTSYAINEFLWSHLAP